ncbi:MAG: ABC transporter ATP-binding protein/permease [Eubacterium sp.]|nr:ABC transporter ATP-binding protein/permease [Eubacterium sp.]
MIEVKNLKKTYRTSGIEQKALDDISITFRDNEFVAILGPSGSGKTTLLNVLGGLDHADTGDLVINGVSTQKYKSSDWETYRNHRIGFIFQSYNLIPHQNILANVELALTLAGVSGSERRERSKKALEMVGLGNQIRKRPSQLSGGQMQRVAIARALVNDPDIVLADEPTGALDTETGIQVMNLLKDVARDRLVIMVTHNPELAESYATRIINLKDGKIIGDTQPVAEEELQSGTAASASTEKESFKDFSASSNTETSASAKSSRIEIVSAKSESASERQKAKTGMDADSGRFTRGGHGKRKKRASMSFLTALSLSFSNLMSKKGRTFLTSFAGSIGITGIAAILAVSTGVNAYISQVEEDTLSSYPVTLTKNSADLTSLFGDGSGSGMTGTDTAEDSGSSSVRSSSSASSAASEIRLSDIIPEQKMLSSMLDSIHSNDLASFKVYLDKNMDKLADKTNAVVYNFGVTPLIYTKNIPEVVDRSTKTARMQDTPVLVNGTNSSDDMATMGASMGFMTGSDSAFQEMLENTELIKSQYDLCTGKWPEKEDEAVLILSSDGSISDYTLYHIGVLDKEEYDAGLKALSDAKEISLEDPDVKMSYEQALQLAYTVLPPSAVYSYNKTSGSWSDLSANNSFMKKQLADGITLKVTGVIKPNGRSRSASLSPGIGYTHALTEAVIREGAESEIVKEQLADKSRDVFTGKTFEELKNESDSAFDLSKIFTVDEDAMKGAFSIDKNAFSGIGSGTSLPADGFSVNNASDLSSALSSVDMSTIIGMMTNGLEDEIKALPEYLEQNGASLTEEEETMITDSMQSLMEQLLGGFAEYSADYIEQKSGTAAADAVRDLVQNYPGGLPALLKDLGYTGDPSGSNTGSETADSNTESKTSGQESFQNAGDSPDGSEISAASGAAGSSTAAGTEASNADVSASGSQASDNPGSETNGSNTNNSTIPGQNDLPVIPDNSVIADTIRKALAEAMSPEEMGQLVTDYLNQDSTKEMVTTAVADLSGKLKDSGLQERITSAIGNYIASNMANRMNAAMSNLISAMSNVIAQQVTNMIASNISSLSSQMQDAMANAFRFDPSGLSNAFQLNMTADELTSLLADYMNSSQLTYDNNLDKLGYADLKSPKSISIYPIDFDAKTDVRNFINDYNSKVKAEGNETRVIHYSDVMGTVMGNVTDIIHMVSFVLIAFVSVSLVVSSIMIGIITYISVLERKKEIGILRAMGASKLNVANIFNAETFIEGLISGIIAIAIVYAVTPFANRMILARTNVPNIMQLKPAAALGLIGISVLLTLIAGIIPSSAASRKDPVEALRSE